MQSNNLNNLSKYEYGMEETNLVDDTFSDRVRNIKFSLKMLDEDIQNRAKMSESITKEIHAQKDKFKFYIQEIRWSFPGYNKGMDSLRNQFLSSLFSLEREEWSEKARCLKDITAIRHKQLEKLEEYHGLVSIFKSMAISHDGDLP